MIILHCLLGYISEFQLLRNRLYPGTGAGVVQFAPGSTRYADAADDRSRGLHLHATAGHEGVMHEADGRKGFARLGELGKLQGVRAEAHRGPGLSAGGFRRMGAGDSKNAYVVDAAQSTISLVDLANKSVGASVPGGKGTMAFVPSPDWKTA